VDRPGREELLYCGWKGWKGVSKGTELRGEVREGAYE
jgi:hypothetical protein